MCCGSCVGCAAFVSNMKFRYLDFQFSIEFQTAGFTKFLYPDFGRINLIVYNTLLWRTAYFVIYPFELAFMSIAKLFVLDRMMTLAKFKQNPALQKRISVASRLVVVLVVCINVVSIAGGIVTAVNLQPIINLYSTAISKYNADPNSLLAFQIVQMDLPEGDSDYHTFTRNCNVQLVSEVVLLALLIAVFVLTGIVCVRRTLALVIQRTDTALEENRQLLLRQISSTVLVIFVSFLLRIAYAILSASTNLWQSQNLTPQQLQVFLVSDFTYPAQLVSALQSISPASDLNCLFLAVFLEKYPEFQISVIMLSSPVTLLVALWGMTTLQARKLLFPFLYSADAISRESTPLSMQKS
jgi:hypothetical protein